VPRLSELPADAAEALRRLPLPEFETTPWSAPPPLKQARVAIVSTAGLHRRDDPVFRPGAGEYRIIPSDVDPADLVMSHVSANFDRSGFQQDVDLVLPVTRLHELAAQGEIGGVSQWHYSFMGATDPVRLEESAREVARLLRGDDVQAALLVPV
jgi:D-proline reductase (dithiol) PrdB